MAILSKLRKRRARFARSLLTALVCLVVANGIGWLGYFQDIDNRLVDAFIYWKSEPEQRDPGVVIVEIDETTFESLGRVQPLDRAYVGGLVEKISQFGPAAIVVDIDLEDPSTPESDGQFVEAVTSAASRTQVVLAKKVRRVEKDGRREFALSAFFPALEALRLDGLHAGLASVPRAEDYIVRNFIPVFPLPNGQTILTMSLAAAKAVQSGTGILPVPEVGSATVDGDAHEHHERDAHATRAGEPVANLEFRTGRKYRIDFRGRGGTEDKSGAFNCLPAFLVAAAPVPQSDDENNLFRDRFVFVGATFSASKDFESTPKGRMAGIEIHANILHTVLNRPVNVPRRIVFGLLLQIAIFPLVSALYTLYRPGWATLGAVVLVLFVLLPLSYLWFASMNYALDFTPSFAPTLLGVALHGFYSDRRAKRRIRENFASHVSPSFVEAIYDEEEDILRGGWREVTVLFCDIRGFSRLSFNTPPETMISFLNEFYTAMTEICFAHRGTVNKYIGDCLLVVFNAPLDDPDHVDHAIETGVEMMHAVRRLQEKWLHSEAHLRFDMGVGIHTGTAFCGAVGSSQKQEYGVLGKNVIIAHELEQFNKRRGTHVLLSRATYEKSSKRFKGSEQARTETLKSGDTVEVVEVEAREENAT
ncbi:adenylate/guanylate cyclase domain-containing protein [Candidatus Sumerlaeota bacterium]|nr:adenylate/guanylate cyclase domain-containing protein [Candidatus Sumerlaeota bacterium]